MKRLILTTILGGTLLASSFGQGLLYFNNSGTTAIFDNFTSPSNSVMSPGSVSVAMLWSADTTATPVTGTNASRSLTPVSWAVVLSDPIFQLALSPFDGSIWIAQTRVPEPVTGTFAGGQVPIQGTDMGQAIKLYVLGWSSAFATPSAAAAANAPVGWSNPFIYFLGSPMSPGMSFPGAGMQGFYVNVVPEPSTFALLAFGAAVFFVKARARHRLR
jgi:hypothetical protein